MHLIIEIAEGRGVYSRANYTGTVAGASIEAQRKARRASDETHAGVAWFVFQGVNVVAQGRAEAKA